MADVVTDLRVTSSEAPVEPTGPQMSKGERIKRALYAQRGWIWMLPMLLLMCVFTFWPIVNTLISAFRENYVAMSNTSDGIGFSNFKMAVTDMYFINCLKNTLIFAFISVPVSTILALLISVSLASIKWLQKAYQSIFFLPYLTNAMSIGAVFFAMFQVVGTKSQLDQGVGGTWGLINNLFGMQKHWVDIDATPWAMRTVIIIYEVWSGLAFKILILFSSIMNVNKQYYDAAKIDSTGRFRVFTKITVPLISPMIVYLVITGFIGAFKSYSAIVGIFGANMGPMNNYEMGTIVGLIYKYIENGQTGIACAASLVLFAMIMVFTGINMAISKRRVHY